jgi:hypothetical protein
MTPDPLTRNTNALAKRPSGGLTSLARPAGAS